MVSMLLHLLLIKPAKSKMYRPQRKTDARCSEPSRQHGSLEPGEKLHSHGLEKLPPSKGRSHKDLHNSSAPAFLSVKSHKLKDVASFTRTFASLTILSFEKRFDLRSARAAFCSPRNFLILSALFRYTFFFSGFVVSCIW